MTARADTLFNASDVWAATGASSRLQGQRYAHHIYMPSKGDTTPRGPGDDRYVTAETVHRIAITEAAAAAGVHIRNAAKSALLFAEDQRGRRANTLFEFGATLLVIRANGAAEILNAQFGASIQDILGRPLQSAFIIDIGPVVKAVNEKLSTRKSK